METFLNITGLLAVGTTFGAMAFFSFVMAPLIFIRLDEAIAGRFIRGVFPVYYLVIGGLGLVAALGLVWGDPLGAAIALLIALGAIVARQVLMPRINRHRDHMLAGSADAERSFERLHRVSVWINGAQILAALGLFVRLAWT